MYAYIASFRADTNLAPNDPSLNRSAYLQLV